MSLCITNSNLPKKTVKAAKIRSYCMLCSGSTSTLIPWCPWKTQALLSSWILHEMLHIKHTQLEQHPSLVHKPLKNSRELSPSITTLPLGFSLLLRSLPLQNSSASLWCEDIFYRAAKTQRVQLAWHHDICTKTVPALVHSIIPRSALTWLYAKSTVKN